MFITEKGEIKIKKAVKVRKGSIADIAIKIYTNSFNDVMVFSALASVSIVALSSPTVKLAVS